MPRKQWATRKNIDEVMQEGWCLSNEYYSEIGQLVKEGKYKDNHFSDKLITLSQEFLVDKVTANNINLIVSVPILRHPQLVSNFAQSLAKALNIRYNNIVEKTFIGEEQKNLLNSFQQQHNIQQSIKIPYLEGSPIILLVDDMVDSRWTFTVIAAELLKAGARAVFPYPLVKTGRGD